MKTTTRTSATRLGVALTMVIATMVSVFALPGVAEAQEEHDVTVEGRGWLYAKGEGDVDIDMGGRIRIWVNGDVSIVDNSGDMRIRLRDETDAAEEERTANVELTDFRGFIHVRGTDFSVSIDGNVKLNAHGRGQAYLVGNGVYKTRHGDRMVWDGMVQLGDPQVQPAG